jgi:hypothetical protein
MLVKPLAVLSLPQLEVQLGMLIVVNELPTLLLPQLVMQLGAETEETPTRLFPQF